jgi:uncharacterized membrane protein YdjX (TVP38/TMEM64 family)
VQGFFQDIALWLEAIGWWAYVVAPLIMAGVAVLPIPAEAPAMINGALFGPLVGTAVSWTGAMLGAHISFELARRMGRPVAERLVTDPALERVDRWVEKAGWWGLLLARFMPLIAFTALNWGAGLTPVSRWRFCWTTAIGIIPGAIVFTASGWGISRLLERLPVLATGLAAAIALFLGIRWFRNRASDQ